MARLSAAAIKRRIRSSTAGNKLSQRRFTASISTIKPQCINSEGLLIHLFCDRSLGPFQHGNQRRFIVPIDTNDLASVIWFVCGSSRECKNNDALALLFCEL